MIPRNFSESNPRPTAWQELAEGAPTILGFANLCSEMLVHPPEQCELEQLSDFAKTILVLASQRGTIEIRAHRDAFDSAERFLAVCVEHDLEQRLLFLQKDDPQQTIRFLEAFHELCQRGLVRHHLQRDFSLSQRGFELARQLNREDFTALIEFGVVIDG